MEKAALLFDKGLCGSIEDIVACGGPFFGNIQWIIASLPIRFGDLGLYSTLEATLYGFVASRVQSWVLQDHILQDSGICGMDMDYACALASLCYKLLGIHFSNFTNEDTPISPNIHWRVPFLVKFIEVPFNMTVRQKVVFECLRAPHAHGFIRDIPIDGLG